MAGSFSNYAENAILNHVFKGTAMTQPTNLYIALSTADPTDDGSGLAEPVGNGYARVNHNTWTITGNAVSNNGAASFPQATGSWGTITHFAVYDALTAGNMIIHGTVTPSQAIVSGNTPSFPTGQLSGTLD